MIKHELRLKWREKRKTLPPELHAEKSQKIALKLLELKEYKDAQRVLFYVSTPEEVDTHFLIQEALKQDKAVFAPKVKGEKVWICHLHSYEDLKPGHCGILEPCEPTSPTHPAEMDLILVPGIVFDRRGHRIGYGKGHYDRLLKEAKGFTVGLAFDDQITEEIPNEVHDIPLDLILTNSTL